MQRIRRYPHGTFSWADLYTTDQAAARDFYVGLFGWEAQEIPMGGGATYTMLKSGGRDVAGLSQMQPELQEQGMPPAWNSYITVDDVEETTARVSELGGAVTAPPFDVMDQGRMSVIQDPTGAVVSLWQPGSHPGSEVANEVGAICWNELATRDPEKAASFYSALLGWESRQDETGYSMFHNNERANGGMMQMSEEWGDIPAHWMVYFTVEDIDATVERVQELGGGVMHGPFAGGEVGRMAVVHDPQGASFYVIQANRLDPIPEEWTAEA